ncbi:MAG: bifunctional aminoglycoside phosphotransferase/ATP-binding protein [Gammaproteobacteria bacterium]
MGTHSATANSSQLPESLMAADAYPHPVQQIRLVETHLSWVFLTGSYVYKIKKPLRLPFVDFSTLDLRKHFCEQELRLNQRFDNNIYLGVVPLIRSQGGRLKIGAPNEAAGAVDFAVKMHQFDSQCQADELLARGELKCEEMTSFGEALAHQYTSMPNYEGDYAPGTAILANFDTLQATPSSKRFSRELARLAAQAKGDLATNEALLRERYIEGKVKDCHGDLHLSNIVRLDNGLRAFDCLEFDQQLRTIDTVCDIAFLFMDCLVRERADLAYAFLDGYLNVSGDYTGASLLPLFAAYRSIVRAKVAALRLEQSPQDESTANKLSRHIEWAYRQIDRPVGKLIITHGYSGSGKSYWAAQLVSTINAIRIRSDVLRKTRAQIPTIARPELKLGEALYSTQTSDQLYAEMVELSRALLSAGENVIVDATCLRRAHREGFYRMANELAAPHVLVSFDAPVEILESRISKRNATGKDPSDADVDVLHWQIQHAEPLARQEPIAIFDSENSSLKSLQKLIASALR